MRSKEEVLRDAQLPEGLAPLLEGESDKELEASAHKVASELGIQAAPSEAVAVARKAIKHAELMGEVGEDAQALDRMLADHGLEERHRVLFANVPPSRWEAHANELAAAGVAGEVVPAHVRAAADAMDQATATGNPNRAEAALLARDATVKAEATRALFGGRGGDDQ